MNEPLAIIFDVETTGIPNFQLPADDPAQPRVASVAAMLVDETGEELESFYHLVKPDWTPEQIGRAAAAFAINGLSMERLHEEGRPIAEAIDAFEAMHAKARIVSCYGISFDTKMMRGELRRAGRPDLYGVIPGFCVQRACTPLCKMPATKQMAAYGRGGQFKIPKLVEAAQILLGSAMEGAHDALVDLQMTRQLFAHMVATGNMKPRGWRMTEKVE